MPSQYWGSVPKEDLKVKSGDNPFQSRDNGQLQISYFPTLSRSRKHHLLGPGWHLTAGWSSVWSIPASLPPTSSLSLASKWWWALLPSSSGAHLVSLRTPLKQLCTTSNVCLLLLPFTTHLVSPFSLFSESSMCPVSIKSVGCLCRGGKSCEKTWSYKKIRTRNQGTWVLVGH